MCLGVAWCVIGCPGVLRLTAFIASSLSTYDFSTFYTTLPQNLIKEKKNMIN